MKKQLFRPAVTGLCREGKPPGIKSQCPVGQERAIAAELKNTGIKYDGDKPDWWLLPVEPMAEVVKVLTHGKHKYGEENWHQLENLEKRYYAAALRHITAYRKGEKHDGETGLHHLAHAICCLVFVLWKELKNELLLKRK